MTFVLKNATGGHRNESYNQCPGPRRFDYCGNHFLYLFGRARSHNDSMGYGHWLCSARRLSHSKHLVAKASATLSAHRGVRQRDLGECACRIGCQNTNGQIAGDL